jgi:hypothetical protein
MLAVGGRAAVAAEHDLAARLQPVGEACAGLLNLRVQRSQHLHQLQVFIEIAQKQGTHEEERGSHPLADRSFKYR